MQRILHTGFDNINAVKGYASEFTFENIQDTAITNSQLKSADLILLGPHTPDVMKFLQRISHIDSLISTIVLPEEKNFNSVKQSLLFTPYMSKHAEILHFNKELAEEIPKAAKLTRQRRKFAKITANFETEKPSELQKTVRMEHLGNFLDQAPIGAVIVNDDLEIVAMNLFSRQMFNLAPLQSVGTLKQIFDKHSVLAIKNHIDKKPTSKVLELFSRQRYFEIHFAEITNESSQKLEILLVADITDRKLEHQRIRTVLDSLPQMAWTTNAEGEVTYLTEGWYKFTGQSFTEAMKNGWLDVIHQDDRPELLKEWQASVITGKPFEFEARYQRHDGIYRWHLVRAIPMLTSMGKVSFWLGTCTDIHDQKEIQKSLSAQVHERTIELTKVNELLKRSNNDLRQFAYVASHDLKEPVRKIKIYLDRFKNSTNEEKKNEFFEKAQHSANRMTDLINGVMAYSEVSGGLAFEMVNLNEVLKNILSDLEMMIQEKEGQVIVDNLPEVYGIRMQLHQLFSNLIINSLKYTRRKPQITIQYRKVNAQQIKNVELREGLDYYEIAVSDNGIGFDKKYIDEIFMMFKRLHNKDEYSGAGIGLALVKKIVTNHAGFIYVESEPEKGSRFIIYLPLMNE